MRGCGRVQLLERLVNLEGKRAHLPKIIELLPAVRIPKKRPSLILHQGDDNTASLRFGERLAPPSFPFMIKRFLPLLLLASVPAYADGPKDNSYTDVRPIPPPGIEVPADVRSKIEAGIKQLRAAIDEAVKAQTQAKNAQLADLLPDVEIYHKALDWALRHNEFLKPEEFKAADEILAEGLARAAALKEGKAPWTKQTGLVVRAYKSKIDGSYQPYGMVIPENGFDGPKRTDIWCRGRDDKSGELQFMQQRRKQVGTISPVNTLVLQPYGRFCCANKFAGEMDAFEALEHAKKFYPIDANRLFIRGFSMGGAASWQFATHYADQWCGANPGSGFSETPEFLQVFQKEGLDSVPWYQQKLWRWYNATDNALNLWHCPTVAYSPELDRQKQAADAMEKALRGENIDMLHVIGEQKSKGITPDKAHRVMPEALVEIERRLADIATAGREIAPETVHFTTWTLIYNKMHWIVVDGLEAQWERCRIHADASDRKAVTIKTQGCTGLTLNMPSGTCKLSLLTKVPVTIDGQKLEVSRPKLDRSWLVHLSKQGGKWQEVLGNEDDGKLAKKEGVCGPIDHAFMSSFLFVKPTGQGWNETGDKWARAEMDRAVFEWRRQFRGDAPAKEDKAITDADIANNNLVLWGDPGSNSVLAKVLAKLPLTWTKEALELNKQKHNAAQAMPVLIYPNPLNPKRYIVINSGFTYREYDYLNNARQVAKLPDWAVVDITKPKTPVGPGGITDAGFFDENWRWKPGPKK